jgi:hypothetical protein
MIGQHAVREREVGVARCGAHKIVRSTASQAPQQCRQPGGVVFGDKVA